MQNALEVARVLPYWLYKRLRVRVKCIEEARGGIHKLEQKSQSEGEGKLSVC